MNERAALSVLVLIAAGAAAWWLVQRRAPAAGAGAAAPDAPADPAGWAAPLLYPDVAEPGLFGSLLFAVEDALSDWKARGEKYRPTIEAAARRHGVPPDLLMRVAYQESRFRDDVISGCTKSPVGAAGMFQFMPGTAADLGVNPLDVASAADGAARYLASNKRKFGSWELALMAYNWGPGNVQKYVAGSKSPPAETRNYVAQIGADVSLA